MQFDVTILGSNAAIPAFNRHPSSQVINYNGNHFLVDCGEGAQFRMQHFNIKRGRLDNIFISHLHGDHFFGLVPLLTSFNLNWREHPLNIYGPPGLKEIIDIHFKYANTTLRYAINFHPIEADAPKVIYEDSCLTVETIILKHRLPTTGFLFKEKPGLRKILSEKITEYSIPHQVINDIKAGADFTTESGKVIPNAELTLDPPAPRSYAYCSDTIYTESFTEQIKGLSTLYHESTFVTEHEERAAETYHTTSAQAAKVAAAAGAGKLLIGHFSARYEDLSQLHNEAKAIFPNTHLAEEGKVFEI